MEVETLCMAGVPDACGERQVLEGTWEMRLGEVLSGPALCEGDPTCQAQQL